MQAGDSPAGTRQRPRLRKGTPVPEAIAMHEFQVGPGSATGAVTRKKGGGFMLSTIRRLALCAAAAAVLVWAFSGAAKAQDRPYALGYYSNANTVNVPDGTLRLVNDGAQTPNPGGRPQPDGSSGGDVCASIYVFDNNENMQECCSCKITPNGYLSLGVNSNLTSNNAPSVRLTRGVIKVVSSHLNSGACDPTFDAPVIGIRGWLTHITRIGGLEVDVEELKDSSFGANEETDLVEDCSVILSTGHGVTGVCSCADAGR
jgi:hypothetical protein